jgi:hypothetical protein
MRAARVDANHTAVVSALRAAGCLVESKKQIAAKKNLEAANAANKKKHLFGEWECAECGCKKPATVHQKRQTYCSKECMSSGYKKRMVGETNPHYSNADHRICTVCRKDFKSYQARKYCSIACRDTVESVFLRGGARKDKNHDEIVSYFEAGGAQVIDLSKALYGIPDIAVMFDGTLSMVEIKNPKTKYGLSKAQVAWAKKFKGFPVYVVRTKTDVENFLSGNIQLVELAHKEVA